MTIEGRDEFQESALGEIQEITNRDPYARDWPFSGEPDPRNIPPDIAAQQEAREATVIENPNALTSVGSEVRAVYDSRPVNGQDFILSAQIQIVTESAWYSASWVIPEGLVAVIRGFRVTPDAVPASTTPGLTAVSPVRPYCSFKVNGISTLGVNNVQLNVSNANEYGAFFYANSGNTLEFAINYSTEIDITADPFPVFVEVYGNYLLSTGIPPQYETGNYKPPILKKPQALVKAPVNNQMPALQRNIIAKRQQYQRRLAKGLAQFKNVRK